MKFSTSPYLPGWEYIPDGEPHIFDGRLYVFGSHDRFNGNEFCENDYVSWSAPVCDLADWRYEGVIYKKTQDPDNENGEMPMWAPDVCRGADGRYYLYYCLARHTKISVAVCDTPAGKYEFYGYVRDKNGNVIGERASDCCPFDPAVFVDSDGSVHLYSGSSPIIPELAIAERGKLPPTAVHMELEHDMLTVCGELCPVIPNVAMSKGTGFEGHEFFEASSMRKFGGKYYFIYSSVRFHELCYALSDSPCRNFKYGGTLISNGDICGSEDIWVSGCPLWDTRIKAYIGNNHGSVEYIKGEYFVFYHRHTNRHQLSRQACVARIKMTRDGAFEQAEMTSSGFGETLPLRRKIEARVACRLYSAVGGTISDPNAQSVMHPCFTQDAPDGEDGVQYISGMTEGACAVYKYLDMTDTSSVDITYRGEGGGELSVLCNGTECGKIFLPRSEEWSQIKIEIFAPEGKSALTLIYHGAGRVDILDFTVQ